jgi:hypothetical protein
MPRLLWVLSLLLTLAGASRAATLTVNLAARGGSLKKAGLGDLFGITTNSAVGPWRYYLTNAFLFVSEHQTRIGEGLTVPCSTSAVGPLLRGTKVKLMCRFGDLCYGWAPYRWPGLNPSWLGAGAANSWLTQVTNACNDIKSNYLDVVHSIAIFNEPEDELVDTNFFNDPNLLGATQPQRMNYVWTQTFRAIRSLLPTVKIMGPNYEDFTPQYHAGDLGMMRDFLTNAIATGTVPDIIGWHILNYNPINPGIIGTSLNTYYRPLEASLGVPGAPLPVALEEFGVNNSAFEGIPGQMVPFWAEFERDGIDFANEGAYGNGGDLGNTMRYTIWDTNPAPNAGWWMMNWYLQMQGQYVPVTKPGNGLDGVASWDSTNQVLTILLGGADGATTVQVNGLSALGLGNTVRVRLDLANWTTNANVAVTGAVAGGDPQMGGYTLYDNAFALDGSGNLAIPVNAVEGLYNGYRIRVTASNAPGFYPTKYEAEAATVNHSILYSTAQASGGTYVGGIDYADSSVTFHVTVASNGLYSMLVRYADSASYGAATHLLTVNGQSQGVVTYPTTAGWSGTELRTTSRSVSLVKGLNDIRLTHATNFAELDFIDVRASTHRYEAELATNNCSLKPFNTCYLNDCVGGINATTNYVEYAVLAPAAGNYVITVAYANGLAGTASDSVTVNGLGAGNLNCFYTGGWFGGGWMSGSNPALVRQFSSVTVSLNAGLNLVRLYKNSNFTEQDYLTITPVSLGPAAAYAFEGNVLDSSGNGNDGTVNGTLTYTSGRIGRAAQFNGANAWVSVPIAIGSMDFSLALWIKTTDTTGSGSDAWYADHGLVDGEIPTVVNDFGTAIGGGYFKFGVGNADTTLTTSPLIGDGNGHHVVATWNAGGGAMQI